MKDLTSITLLLLGATIAGLSYFISFGQPEIKELATVEEGMSKEEIALENIMTRGSVRKYTQEQVSMADIETMLKAGMAAPTGGNRQPWEFVVIQDKEILKQLPNVTKYAQMAPSAPLAIVVCGVPAKAFPEQPEYWVQDTSAATENILLAAHALGLGAVWCGVYPGEDRVRILSELIELPEGVVPLNFIVIGHPDGSQTVKDKWKPEKVRYIK